MPLLSKLCLRTPEKVERFELLVAKRPVPRDVSVGPRAPALMMLDLSSRLEQAAFVRRRKREVRDEQNSLMLYTSSLFLTEVEVSAHIFLCLLWYVH